MRVFFLVLAIACFQGASAQQNEFVILEGKVVSAATSEPLPFATLSLAGNRVGTIANASGEFRFRIPQKFASISIDISYVGYKPSTWKISEMQQLSVYKLEEDPQVLSEVVISGMTAWSVIEKAIEKIPENYQGNPYISTGFYRTNTRTKEMPLHLSEAVFDIFYPENSSKKKLFRLDKMRAIKDEKQTHGITVGRSPESLIISDVVNNLKGFELLNKSGLKQHEFYLDGTYDYLGNEVYQISFEQKADMKKVGYEGTMLIDKKSMAFVAFDYSISEESLSLVKLGSSAVRALMKMMDIQINVLAAETKITYKKIGEKYYLSESRDTGKMLMKSDREQFDFVADINNHYIVTDISLDDAVPFSNDEVLGKNKMIEMQSSVYDTTFWDDYNIILPDIDFEETAKTISASNESQQHKEELENVIFKYPKEKTARVDSILTFYNRKGLFNGNALVEYQGEVILQKSYNNNYTNNVSGSQFRIGSTSKTFVSNVILQLEAEGKLDLGDSIEKFLPDYVHGNVTIEQLLTHQSGIPNFLDDKYFGKIFEGGYSVDELINSFCSDSLEFTPGAKFNYTNSGYVILSAIIEKVEGKEYAQVLKERVFDPLEMKNTFSGTYGDSSQVVVGYMQGREELGYPIENVIGAGGITSTTDDLLKWSRSFSNSSLMSAEQQEQLFAPRTAYEDWGGYYGYGWIIDKFMFSASKKHEVVYHPGTDMGFYTMFVKQPDEEITIVLLNNTSDFPRFEMTDLILDQLN